MLPSINHQKSDSSDDGDDVVEVEHNVLDDDSDNEEVVVQNDHGGDMVPCDGQQMHYLQKRGI